MTNERSLTRKADALSFESAFDYGSVFSFNNFRKTECSVYYEGTNGEGLGGMEKVLRAVIFTLGFFLLLPLSPIVLWLCLHSLPQWERVAIFRLGRLKGIQGPGYVLLLPCIDKWRKIDLRTQMFTVPPMQVITSDRGILEVGADVQYRVADVSKFILNISRPEEGLRMLGRCELMNIVSKHDVSALARNTVHLEEMLRANMTQASSTWGIEISCIILTSIKVLKDGEGPQILHSLSAVFSNITGVNIPLIPLQDVMHLPQPSASSVEGFKDSELLGILKKKLANVHVSEDMQGIYEVVVNNGEAIHIILNAGRADVISSSQSVFSPDVSVMMNLEDLEKLIQGRISPLAAYIGGKITIQGNASKFQGLESLFSS